MSKRVRVAVIGAGYLGKYHAEKYASMEDVELVCVVDVDSSLAMEVAGRYGAEYATDFRTVTDRVDAVSVVVPTVFHAEVTAPLLEAGIHVMLEKPVTVTVEEADRLISIAERRGVILQAGHMERFNPAVKLLMERVSNPLFIEAHRISGFKGRATDVDVVLDLMIHDIDIVQHIVRSPLREIRAAGVPVLTPNVDIANVRLMFENGCTANLTASRISLSDMRRIRVFEPGCYISADCMEKSNLVVRKELSGDAASAIVPELKQHTEKDNLMAELRSFIDAVLGRGEVVVSGVDGRNALETALEINRVIASGLEQAEKTGVISLG
jgi:predicted dehydrogenase